MDHKKYHDCKKTYYNIRSLSDDLCREHELSIITPGEKRGKTYKEWQSSDNAEKFIITRKIDSFENLEQFTADRERRYRQLEEVHLSRRQPATCDRSMRWS